MESITLQLLKEDYISAVRNDYQHQRKGGQRWKRVVFYAAFLICIFSLVLSIALDGVIYGTLYNPLFWILLIFFTVFNKYTVARISYNTAMQQKRIDPRHFDRKTLTVTPEKIMIDTESTDFHESVAFSSVTELYMTKNEIIAKLGKQSIFYIPRRVFATQARYENYFNQLKTYYEEAKKNPKNAVPEIAVPIEKEIFHYDYQMEYDGFITMQLAYSSYLKKYYCKWDLRFWIFIMIILILLMVGVLLVGTGTSNIIWGIYLWLIALFFVYLMIASYVRPPWLIKILAKNSLKHGKTMVGTIGPRTCVLTEEGISQTIGGTQISKEWKQVNQVWEDKGMLFLLSSQVLILCLPWRFVPLEEQDALRSFIRQKANLQDHAKQQN